MFRLISKNGLKKNQVYATLSRGYKFQVKGIIPGGGLRKLQGIKEEEYFSKQDNEIFKNIKNNFENSPINNIGCNPCKIYSNKIPKHQPCSVKHKNLLEEAYFLNENCDCIQMMKSKNNKENCS